MEERLVTEKTVAEFGSMDRAFLLLRILVLFGGFGWLYFSPFSLQEKIQSLLVFLFFSFYTAALYVAIFFSLERIRFFYLVGLFFDLIFIFLLLMLTGGAESSIFIAFYVLVALHSFYYGLVVGSIVSMASSLFYFVSYVDSGFPIHWTDFLLRIFFLFLLSLSAGLLHRKMEEDKVRIAQLNQKLKRSLINLENVQQKLIETAKLTALGLMTTDVAHEIRNPLVTIGGYARRCFSKMDPAAPEKKYSRIIVQEVERLEKILRDLLTFSSGPRRESRPIAIKEALEKSIEMYGEEIQEKDILVVREYADDIPEFRGDEAQLQQVFRNMVLNAVQAMSQGGVLTVGAGSRTVNGEPYLTVFIRDTGSGIPAENLDRIFDPFFSTKDGGEGTGLGLSVSRRIVEEHEGRIEVESAVGDGSMFIVLLPLREKKGEREEILEVNRG